MKRGYFSEDEIVTDQIARLTEDNISDLRALKRTDVIGMHHTAGRFIRNYYRLWDEQNPFVNSDPAHDDFPDQISHRVLIKLWEHVHGSKITTPTV